MIASTLPVTALTLVACGGLMGCVAGARAPSDAPTRTQYLGVDTRLLEGDLVSFVVQVAGDNGQRAAIAYTRCAAAQYALIRGYHFARHLRTNTAQKGGIWEADGVYTISPDLPRGTRTIDAEVVVDDCKAQNIPTV
ncbi:MAG: hypothetical protein GVY34_04590 [Alphaproteobacteria bacterium]|jgi:hypothetical protein|nr:hypothetical protein [Alphaproteobacteria bacterium]